MFELPELQVLAAQINDTLLGKQVARGELSNSPHKFVWHNLSHAEFADQIAGKQVGAASARGRWLFFPMEPGYVLLVGEVGGKFLYLPPGSPAPKKYHLLLEFEDGSQLAATTQMWGAYELYPAGEELLRPYVKDMRPTPLDEAFNSTYFAELVRAAAAEKKTSAKALLTQDQLIPGLGNSVAQDILFRAGLHPRHPIDDLDAAQVEALFRTILDTVHAVIKQGGRYDEIDLFGQPGGYPRIMDKHAPARPCPRCGGKVEKIQYLGGSCYLCPGCQL